MWARASPGGLATVVMCLALVLTVYGTAGAAGSAFVTQTAFDITITSNVTSGSYHYKYTVTMPNGGSGEDMYGWYLTGAFDIDPSSITETDYGNHNWYLGEIVQPGDSPSCVPAGGLQNTSNTPAIWWLEEGPSGEGTGSGIIGVFEFESSSPPTNREWLAHSDGTASVTGWAQGPTPELSPLLLMLGQGVPILGWIGLRRRRGS